MVKFLMMSAKKATPVATGEKLVVGGGGFLALPILNRVKGRKDCKRKQRGRTKWEIKECKYRSNSHSLNPHFQL